MAASWGMLFVVSSSSSSERVRVPVSSASSPERVGRAVFRSPSSVSVSSGSSVAVERASSVVALAPVSAAKECQRRYHE